MSSLSKVIQKLIYTKKFLKKNLFPPKRIHVNAFGTYCYDMFKKEELEKCYNHFKKHFYNAVFLENTKVPEYAIDEAIKIEEKYNDNGLYLEFGVFKGNSINLFAKKMKKKISTKIHGFDSFEGLREDWKGHVFYPKGSLNLNKKLPLTQKNVVLITGWIQDTLPKFLENNKYKINFIHIDVDTYETTKFILNQTKKYLRPGSIILFDDLYNFSGWSVGEYKALTEELNENEYQFVCFSLNKGSAFIKLN